MSQFWTYDGKLFHCSHPGCPYTSESPNAVQGHYIGKHQHRTAKPPTQVATPPANDEGAPTKPKGHQHHWRLLRRNAPGKEGNAYAAGMREVCDECRDVR